jgi:group I intron endonuclease
MHSVYAIEHRESGRVYIGKARNVARRWAEHRRSGLRGYYLHRALQKHGADQFDWWVVQHCASNDEASAVEIEWIARLKSAGVTLFNITDGGDGALGRKHSDETRRKLAEAQRGRRLSDETRRKMSLSRTNPSSLTRSKMSKAHKGKKHTNESCQKRAETLLSMDLTTRAEWIRKISVSRTGKKHSEETRRKISEGLRKRSTCHGR